MTFTPAYTIKSTVNHPARPEEVIGFASRNTRLGREAVVLKDDAIESGTVLVPEDVSEGLINGEGELAVLNGDEVLTMDASDFVMECQTREVEGRGQTVSMNAVELASESFRSWHQSNVEISN